MWTTPIKEFGVKVWRKVCDVGLWIKARAKKLLIITGIIGVAFAGGLGDNTVPYVDFNGTIIEFPYTDDNTGENMIIRADSATMVEKMYFMVENKYTKDQTVDVQMSFPSHFTADFDLFVLEIDVPYEQIVPKYKTVQYDCTSTASTTDEVIKKKCDRQEIESTSTVSYTVDEWRPITLEAFNKEQKKQIASTTGLVYKDTKGYEPKKTAKTDIKKDKIKYFKLEFKKRLIFTSAQEEFFIEVIGSDGSYGHLDPYIAGYERRRPIVIDQTKVDGDLANFPVLVKLTSSNFDFSKANSDGFDIRFTSSDGETLLKYERERHSNASSMAEYWVKVPTISSTTDTTIYIYYTATDTADGADPENVWDDNFVSVHHLTGAAKENLLDSTHHNHDMTADAGTPGYNTECKIGYGIELDGVNEKVSAPDDPGYDCTTGITMEQWVYLDNTATGNAWGATKFWDGAARAWGVELINDEVTLVLGTAGGGDCIAPASTNFNLSQSTWYYVVGKWSKTGGVGHAYYNAGIVSDVTAAKSDDLPGNGAVMALGQNSGGGGYYDGKMDEIRISDIERSLWWISASYYSGMGTLLNVQDEETTYNTWLSGYDTRIKLTVDSSKVDTANLTNFPVLVKLTASNFNFTHANSDGYDIRFTKNDGETLFKYERERHDSVNSVAEYWVKLPLIYEATDTVFYMYFRTADTADGADATNTWDSNYVMVQHLNGTASSTTLDSTQYNNDIIKDGGTPTYNTSAKIGTGVYFLTDDYIQASSSASLTATSSITIETWVNADKLSASQYLVDKYYSVAHSRLWGFLLNNDEIEFDMGQWAGDDNMALVTTDFDLATSTWYHLGCTWALSDNKMYAYKNGVISGNTATRASGDNMVSSDTPVSMGHIYAGSNYLDGCLDEVRISNVRRSTGWMKASYHSGNDTLLTYSAQEDEFPPAPVPSQIIIIE